MSSSKKRKRPPLTARIFFSKPSVALQSFLAKAFLKLLYLTLRIQVEERSLLEQAAKGKLIIALWHDGLLLAPILLKLLPHSTFACVVSRSRDGRVLASYVDSLPRTKSILVGHHNRHGALLETLEALGKHIIVITPDGPRGPRHVAKDGLFYLAEKSQSQIMTLSWHSERLWQLNTWDRLRIPKPFSCLTLRFDVGAPK